MAVSDILVDCIISDVKMFFFHVVGMFACHKASLTTETVPSSIQLACSGDVLALPHPRSAIAVWNLATESDQVFFCLFLYFVSLLICGPFCVEKIWYSSASLSFSQPTSVYKNPDTVCRYGMFTKWRTLEIFMCSLVPLWWTLQYFDIVGFLLLGYLLSQTWSSCREISQLNRKQKY